MFSIGVGSGLVVTAALVNNLQSLNISSTFINNFNLKQIGYGI